MFPSGPCSKFPSWSSIPVSLSGSRDGLNGVYLGCGMWSTGTGIMMELTRTASDGCLSVKEQQSEAAKAASDRLADCSGLDTASAGGFRARRKNGKQPRRRGVGVVGSGK